MIEIRETPRFAEWFRELPDIRAKGHIDARIRRLSLGAFGDVAPVGDGVSELRVHHGPGYRIYFTHRGSMIVILLCGGDKNSQQRDIRAARTMARELGS